jgi:hypothetical protein
MATVRDNTRKTGDLDLDDEGAKAFTTLLMSFEDGALNADLSRELLKLNQSLRDQAKLFGPRKGELTLSLKLICDEHEQVMLTTSYKVKAPVLPRKRTAMWLTPGGNLQTTNPRQLELGVRAVPVPDAPVKDAPENKPREMRV